MPNWPFSRGRNGRHYYEHVQIGSRSTRDSESDDDNLRNGDVVTAKEHLQNARKLRQMSLVFFSTSCLLLLLAATQPWHLVPHKIWHRPASQSSFPPPPSLRTKTIDAKLLILPDTPGALYRAPPSPEVDAAWNAISSIAPIPISEADVLGAGKDPSKAARFNSSFGFGENSYVGRLDVLHQTHCLNRLRQEVYKDYYDGQWSNEMHKLHLSHCIWYLLQNIICHGSWDVYTHIWTDTFDYPYPDFNIPKRCRSFDEIYEYQEKHSVDKKLFEQMRIPKDYGPPAKMTRKFKEIHEWYKDHEDDGSEGDVIG